MKTGTIVCGLGLTLIPYVSHQYIWLTMGAAVMLLSTGNALFQPSFSAILAQRTREEGQEMGMVMGSQESALYCFENRNAIDSHRISLMWNHDVHRILITNPSKVASI